MTLSSKQNRQKNSEHSERRKTSLLKEQVENADLHKSVLSKVMTTHEE